MHETMRGTVVGLSLLLVASSAGAQTSKIADTLGLGKSALSNEKIANGLKEALQVGTGNAVKSTGKEDGYFKHAVIKILMPEKLRTLEKGLRAAGQGAKVNEFILSMNRAAEKSAPLAKDIFWGAIKEMTFEDAKKILSGNETAATDYFKTKTTVKLSEAFAPIVKKATDEAGVTRQYKDLTAQARAIPFFAHAGRGYRPVHCGQSVGWTILHGRRGRKENPQRSRRARHFPAERRVRPQVVYPVAEFPLTPLLHYS